MKVLYVILNGKQQFGISAVDTCTMELIESINDISVNRKFVEKLICNFNEYELSILHFKDAVEDSLE